MNSVIFKKRFHRLFKWINVARKADLEALASLVGSVDPTLLGVYIRLTKFAELTGLKGEEI